MIDYTRDDFTKDSEKYDFVFDAAGKSTFCKCKPLLKKNRIYSSSGGRIYSLCSLHLIRRKKVIFCPPKNLKACLSFISDLVEKGNFRAVVDRKYWIDIIAEAYKYVAR